MSVSPIPLTSASKRSEAALFQAHLQDHPNMTFAQLDDLITEIRARVGVERSADGCKALRAMLYKHRGVQLYNSGRHADARARYMDGIRARLDRSDLGLPAEEPYVVYKGIEAQQMVDLAGLANNIVLTYQKQGNVPMALRWLEEVETLYHVLRLSELPDKFDWMDYAVALEEYVSIGVKARDRMSQIFESLRNTSMALAMGTRASLLLCKNEFVYPPSFEPTKRRIFENVLRLSSYWHPHPAFAHLMHNITEPTLQIKGSWNKLSIENRISGRSGACVWIWRSKLYVFDGRNLAKGVLGYEDFSCLDLTVPEGQRRWRKLPGLPAPKKWKQPLAITNKLEGWDVVVHDNAAWIFLGTLELGKFDLLEEKWGIVQTRFPNGTWPYDWKLNAHKMSLYKDTLYLFGGSSAEVDFGLDVFMALDLKTLKWRQISGTRLPRVKQDSPGLREYGETWVVPHEEKLYLLYGSALRQASGARCFPNVTGTADYVYTDLWSFHIPTDTWKRELMHGNIPCPRTEFTATYNPVLDRAFVFGGYNGSLCHFDQERHLNFTFTYFADTFMWTPQTKTWAQVMTRGFPTSRACSSLVTDPDTGKIYVFGGYVNSTYVDHGKQSRFAKAYSDVWQLCVDMPGGDWDTVDLEEEARLASLGEDKRCFNCGHIGRLRACGGTCKGKVSFCGKECIAQAWPEHKQQHGCRKQ